MTGHHEHEHPHQHAPRAATADLPIQEIPGREGGFTLLEALIALAIVALVITTCLVFRTGSLIDAQEARNWRVAREVAQEILSELQAGARQEPPQYDMAPQPIPSMKDVPDWTYQVVIGEERISQRESDLESEDGTESGASDSEGSMTDRRDWQKERDDLRKAREQGVSFQEYRDKSAMSEEERRQKEDAAPSEEDFEDVAVFVRFPNARYISGKGGEFSHFVLKARLPTMAIEGVTPEEAEAIAGSKNKDQNAPASGGAADPGGTSK